jgi:uroporphyrinogen decarboxylase
VQIFDSWANALAFHQFEEFSCAYMRKILNGIKDTRIPVILFCRGSSVFASQLARLNPEGISLDWNCRMSDVRRSIPYPTALQGNLDPDVLYAPIPKIKEEAFRLLSDMKGDRGFIFNLGHGIAPDVSEDSVQALVASVRKGG